MPKTQSGNQIPDARVDSDAIPIEELMQASYKEFGISGSPFVFPAVLRRIVARIAATDYRIFALIVWFLHRAWGFFGRAHAHPLAKAWSELAWQFTLRDGLQLGAAFAALDEHPTFRNGCSVLGFKNCLDAVVYRGAFLDPFFRQGPWEITETTHPLQQPHYFIPGIPSRRWYDAEQFPWTEFVEQNFERMRDELIQLLRENRESFSEFQTEIAGTIDGWNSIIFYANGRRQNESCARAPAIAEIADALITYEEGELTMLSSLSGDSFISPHVGPMNGILRCHLPLLIPNECGLRVGGEVVEWVEGKVLVFDDSFVHDVWNRSNETRIVLFFNAWHPVLSRPERKALANVRRAYNNTPPGRHWLKQNEKVRRLSVNSETAATSGS